MKFERLSCAKRLKLLCDYIDKELPASARKAVAAHRRSCLPCEEVLTSLTRTIRLLKTSRSRTGPPASARRALKAALAKSRPKG